MPQMAPTLWSLNMMMIVSLIMVVSILLFFNKEMKFMGGEKKSKNINWKW